MFSIANRKRNIKFYHLFFLIFLFLLVFAYAQLSADNIYYIKDSFTVSKIITVYVSNNENIDVYTQNCLNLTGKNTNCTIKANKEIIKTFYTYLDFVNDTYYKPKSKMIISSLVVDFEKLGYYCSNNNKYIICDSVNDGNGNGECTSGESCFIYEIATLNNVYSKTDSPNIKKINIGIT